MLYTSFQLNIDIPVGLKPSAYKNIRPKPTWFESQIRRWSRNCHWSLGLLTTDPFEGIVGLGL